MINVFAIRIIGPTAEEIIGRLMLRAARAEGHEMAVPKIKRGRPPLGGIEIVMAIIERGEVSRREIEAETGLCVKHLLSRLVDDKRIHCACFYRDGRQIWVYRAGMRK